jgi:hypothetical protein
LFSNSIQALFPRNFKSQYFDDLYQRQFPKAFVKGNRIGIHINDLFHFVLNTTFKKMSSEDRLLTNLTPAVDKNKIDLESDKMD